MKALEGNIGTLVAFECNQDDAHSALSLMPGFSATDLMNMGRYKSVVSMRPADGTSRAAFSLEPLAAPDVSTERAILTRERAIRRKSVENYTPKTYDEVNQHLNDRYAPRTEEAPTPDDTNAYGNPIS